MRKLLLSILALVLLATTAVAMPEGWRQLNGMMQNVPVSQQADAIERGGSFYLDLDAKALALYPWADGSTDVLYMQPVGLEYDGPMVETPYGWKIPLKNHIYGATFLHLVDLQSARVPDALENYLGNGVALIYSGMPVANIPQGEWIPKRIAFSGMVDDCTFDIQQPLTQQEIDDGSARPSWADYSIPIYHNTKSNNRGFRKYTTGKIGDLPRPVAFGWLNGEITGWAYGRYREVSHGVFDKVFFRNAQFDADMTRRGTGNPQTISVSADIGHNSQGASTNGTSLLTSAVDSTGVPSMTEDGILKSMSNFSSAAGGADIKIINESIDVGVREDLNVTAASRVGNLNTYNFGANPALTSGNHYEPFIHANSSQTLVYFDSTAYGYERYTHTYGTSFPVAGAPAASSANVRMSLYFTYDLAGTTPPTVTFVTASPSEVTAGTDISLIAAITDDDHTISAAEYYIGVDQGEGSNIAMALGAGTTSRTATATIDTTLLEGAYTVRVRGKDETDGWGATNFDTFTVNAAPVGGGDNAGLNLGIGLEL